MSSKNKDNGKQHAQLMVWDRDLNCSILKLMKMETYKEMD